MANLLNILIIVVIAVTQGMQVAVWYNFFFRTPHPGPKEVIIANHVGFIGTFLLLVPGVVMLAHNQSKLGWYTAVYGVAALLEIVGTAFATAGMKKRRAEVAGMVKDLETAAQRVTIIRHRREILLKG